MLSMNVRFRSNDAYKAAFMNIFALVQLQQRIAAPHRRAQRPARSQVGRYCHMADSYHIYGSYFQEFEGRFLGMLAEAHLRAAHPALRRRAGDDGRGAAHDPGEGPAMGKA